MAASNTDENSKPRGKFKKGDPRINRNGRPRTFDAVRKLAVQVAAEQLEQADGQTRILLMLRAMSTSRNPADRALFLAYAFGKPADKQEISGPDGGPIEVKPYNYATAIAPIAPGPEPDRLAPGEGQDHFDGPALGEDTDGG
jgi:hypothetical protein